MTFWNNACCSSTARRSCIDKPAGLAVHPGPRTPASLEDLSRRASFRLPAPRRCRSTGSIATLGCLLLARNPKAHKRFQPRSRQARSARPMSRCSTACPRRSRRQDRPAARQGLDREEGWRMVADPHGQAGGDAAGAVAGVGDGRAVVALHAGDRPHPPDPRPRRRRARHPDRRRSRLRPWPRPGTDAAPRLALRLPRDGKRAIEAEAPLPETFAPWASLLSHPGPDPESAVSGPEERDAGSSPA